MSIHINIDPKDHSVEGHTKECWLEYEGNTIWGPIHCHPNTWQIAEALHRADPKLYLGIRDREKSIEGHIVTITIKRGDEVLLDRLSTHDNMTGLRDAVQKVLG